ncbi:MAG: NAD-dependent epimerase/dehydratase family protein [Actinobacteria bacterium]|nr:NAD-dependent epimerase/dehydratase family protein [Actinomycetota bacterium]
MSDPSHHGAEAERVKVVVVGLDGPLRHQVTALLEDSPTVERVTVLDPPGSSTDLEASLAGVTTLVDLARRPRPEPGADLVPSIAEHSGALVEAAAGAGVDHVVVVSSAAVYGARPENPVPLTEEAALHPNPGAGYAVEKAEIERRWAAWAHDTEGARLAVLRPALVVGEHEERWLAVALRAASWLATVEGDAPAQFLHVDDLAAAVALAVERRLDGSYNVAPAGWLAPGEVRALTGALPRLPVPRRLATSVTRWSWHRGLGSLPPDLIAYGAQPWVVAGDRLRAEGWEARHSNAEALVEAYEGMPWTRLSPKRRQELALGTATVAVVGGPLALAAFARRWWRRRQTGG